VKDRRLLVYTVGHSTHSLEGFVELLTRHGITAVADVRSAPFSRFNPQFNKDVLDRSLKDHQISYLCLGRELGARSDDPSCYEHGRVQYARLAQTELFKRGIEHVLHEAEEHRIALMCAEKEPLECHRALLVARVLEEQGAGVEHILGDGSLESHEAAMDRLLKLSGFPQEELFRTRDVMLAEALARQEEKIAYVDEELAPRAVGDAR
jgi:uncharacterized protein (DUF488 family)